MDYLKDVKETLDHDKYIDFLLALKDLNSSRVDITGVNTIMKAIFQNNDNLLYGLESHLLQGYACKKAPPKKQKVKKMTLKKTLAFVNKVKKYFKHDEGKYLCFLNAFGSYQKGYKNIDHVKKEVTELLKDSPKLLAKFKRFTADQPSLEKDPKTKTNRFRPNTELDEEILFMVEDDQYQLDVLFSNLRSTVKNVEKIVLDSITKGYPNKHMNVIQHLTALNLRCIERLYNGVGLDVIKLLHENPIFILSVILPRLKQKRRELKHFKSEANKVWAKVYEEHNQ